MERFSKHFPSKIALWDLQIIQLIFLEGAAPILESILKLHNKTESLF